MSIVVNLNIPKYLNNKQADYARLLIANVLCNVLNSINASISASTINNCGVTLFPFLFQSNLGFSEREISDVANQSGGLRFRVDLLSCVSVSM